MPEAVRIHYHRPPARTDVFVQELVERTPAHVITLMRSTPLPRPVLVDGAVVLEHGSPVLWFTYPGRMHDVGIFHDSAGRCTGYYANVLTPVRFRAELEWETTDLFLDVWAGADGSASLLDQDEFDEAVAAGWIDAPTARSARAEAERLLAAAQAGEYPPREVREWTLARALARTPQGTAG